VVRGRVAVFRWLGSLAGFCQGFRAHPPLPDLGAFCAPPPLCTRRPLGFLVLGTSGAPPGPRRPPLTHRPQATQPRRYSCAVCGAAPRAGTDNGARYSSKNKKNSRGEVSARRAAPPQPRIESCAVCGARRRGRERKTGPATVQKKKRTRGGEASEP
jgi:hypothetical protein